MISISTHSSSSIYHKVRIAIADKSDFYSWRKVVRYVPRYLPDGHYRVDMLGMIPITVKDGEILITGHGDIKLFGDYSVRISERNIFSSFYCQRQKCYGISANYRPIYSPADKGFIHPVYEMAEAYIRDTSTTLVYNNNRREVLDMYSISRHYALEDMSIGSRPVGRLARFLDLEYWRGFYIVAKNANGDMYLTGADSFNPTKLDSKLFDSVKDRVFVLYAIPVEQFFVKGEGDIRLVSKEHVASLCTKENEHNIGV